jgi:hypothetical protein
MQFEARVESDFALEIPSQKRTISMVNRDARRILDFFIALHLENDEKRLKWLELTSQIYKSSITHDSEKARIYTNNLLKTAILAYTQKVKRRQWFQHPMNI